MPLTLRPAQMFSTLNSSQSDDYDVMDNSKRVDRLFRADSVAESWCWSLSTAVWSAGLSGRAATKILALEGLADAYTAVSTLNGTEYQSRLSKLGPDRSSARKPTVRSVAQHMELTLGQTAIRRFDRE